MAAAILYFMLGLLIGRIKIAVILAAMLIIAGAVEVQYELKKDSHSYLLLAGYYLVTAALGFYFSQYLLDQGIANIDHLKLLLNTLLIFFCYMIFFSISGSVITSAVVETFFYYASHLCELFYNFLPGK